MTDDHRGRPPALGYGLGTAPLGILPHLVDAAAARACLHRAVGLGVRYLDTAPFYGAGLAESRLGAFLAEHDRADLVLSTKVGRSVVARGRGATTVFDFSGEAIRRQLDASLRRMRVDRIDTVFLHDPDDHWTEALDQAWPVLAELRDQGVVGSVGAGMNQVPMLTRFVQETDMDVVLLANRYTLLEPEAALGLLDLCLEREVSVVLGGVLNSGILATGDVPSAQYEYAPAPASVRARVARIEAVCRSYGVPLAAAALQFARGSHPAVASVLIGARSAAEIEANLRLTAHPVPPGLWDALSAESLLPDGSRHELGHGIPAARERRVVSERRVSRGCPE
ncbi:aldo/keto reductase [Streptacidiphilus sp. P02-A3a]|uniref:aldo/keto reductase n=1 Tax=Streptacidiphilus sp. P02-A3a TaxID=2704468 RepID=UPI0015FE63E2|nr:aldo/keto reductase [Streptacidiphilus sp. P02-A3a]QMU71389.1 aldo/keto reductase [Streptacidiphilus sp. P02-A3a]